jgi:hypothetical protein
MKRPAQRYIKQYNNINSKNGITENSGANILKNSVKSFVFKKNKLRCKRYFGIAIFTIISLIACSVVIYNFTKSNNVNANSINVIDTKCTNSVIHNTKLTNNSTVNVKFSKKGYSSVGLLCSGQYYSNVSNIKPQPIASLTKVITSLVVIDKLPNAFNTNFDKIKITKKFYNLYKVEINRGGTVALLKKGSYVSKKELLTDSLIISANNAINILALNTFGSYSNYKNAAYKYLKAHNINNTILGADASGIDNKTKSTPADLFALARLAMQNNTIKNIVKLKKVKVHLNGKLQTIKNTNTLVKTNGFVGLKTGFTTPAGSCLLFAKYYKNNLIVGVVMHQKSTYIRNKTTLALVKSFEKVLNKT